MVVHLLEYPRPILCQTFADITVNPVLSTTADGSHMCLGSEMKLEGYSCFGLTSLSYQRLLRGQHIDRKSVGQPT